MKAFRVFYSKVFSVVTRVVIAKSEDDARKIIMSESRHNNISNIVEEPLEHIQVKELTIGDLMKLGVINGNSKRFLK